MGARHRISAALIGLSALSLSACIYQPARFADREATTAARDDRPIRVPKRRIFLSEVFQADTYVRRELVKALDPRRYLAAGDVNSLDDVVHSSWFRTEPTEKIAQSKDWAVGPPQPPFKMLNIAPRFGDPKAAVFEDRRGLRYERVDDTKDRPRMRTAAAAISSRLVYALGYRTPPVWVVHDEKGQRFAATRWPLGIDLGPTSPTGRRSDDPNDQIDHADRRSLRAIPGLTAWLDIERVEPTMLRDVYVGKPNRGHVQHHIVGLDQALGVGRYETAVVFARDPDREPKNFFLRMFSMGLSPKPPPFLPTTRWPGVGLITERVSPESFDPSPPLEPLDRRDAGDDYWLAKRLQNVSRMTIARAVQAGKLPPIEQNWLFRILLIRRNQVIERAMQQVTPCEALGIESLAKPKLLLLRDLSTRSVPSPATHYAIEVLDQDGERLERRATQTSSSDFSVPLVEQVLARGYVVLKIWRRGHPRPVEVHILHDANGTRVRGVRH
jgi:hypothetical protein